MIDCCYNSDSEKLFLFAGSYSGDIVMFQPVPDDLIHSASLAGGHTDVVRSIVDIPQAEFILSGSEDGRLCQWEPYSEPEDEEMDTDEPALLSGKNLRREDLRQRFRYVLNPYYLKKR